MGAIGSVPAVGTGLDLGSVTDISKDAVWMILTLRYSQNSKTMIALSYSNKDAMWMILSEYGAMYLFTLRCSQRSNRNVLLHRVRDETFGIAALA